MNDNSHEGKLARIEGRLDRPVANAIAVRSGSMTLNTMADVMEASKLMSLARQGVPKHLREEPGLCFSVIMQAISWEMDILAVARQSFVINDFVSYGSQLIHAVIETRAPLRKRLRCTYSGEGSDRQCTVMGTFVGEDEPHTYTTPKLKDIPVKNSPLWKWDVDQQLFYLASRAWARKWCPDVLLGVYSRDEAEFIGERATQVMERIHNPLQDDADLAPQPEMEVMPSGREVGAQPSLQDKQHETSPTGATWGGHTEEPSRAGDSEQEPGRAETMVAPASTSAKLFDPLVNVRTDGRHTWDAQTGEILDPPEAEKPNAAGRGIQPPDPDNPPRQARRKSAGAHIPSSGIIEQAIGADGTLYPPGVNPPIRPHQAPTEAAGEPNPEPAPEQPDPQKTSPGPNPALGVALEQPWIKRTPADYITYLWKWTEAWAKWGQDPIGLRDRFQAERTIRNGFRDKMDDKQLAECKAIASGAFARLGGVPK